MSAPGEGDEIRLKRVCRYIAGTMDYELKLEPATSELVIEALVDSDWAGDKVTRRSTSSAHVYLLGALVHSHSRTQASLAQSSAEA